MGGQPLALAVGLAVAAVLSLALTILSLVRRRRGELALLKVFGMTRAQIWAVIAWQTTLTLLIAVLAGGVLGIIGGRLAWRAFAGSLGVVPVIEVPVPALILGLAALVLAGNLLAAAPRRRRGPDQARGQPARRIAHRRPRAAAQAGPPSSRSISATRSGRSRRPHSTAAGTPSCRAASATTGWSMPRAWARPSSRV